MGRGTVFFHFLFPFSFLVFLFLAVWVEEGVGVVAVPSRNEENERGLVWWKRGILSFFRFFHGLKNHPNEEKEQTRELIANRSAMRMSLRITRQKLRTEVYTETSQYPFRVAVCYWGLTRTLETVYPNHVSYLYDPLRNSKIEYDVFIHKWYSSQGTEFVWSSPSSPSKRTDWSILKPYQAKVEDQDEFRQHSLNFSSYYFPGEDARAIPGDWNKRLLLNHLLSLESLKRVTFMVSNSNQYYDAIVFIRPDSALKGPLPVQKLRELPSETILIPDEEHFLGYNDRFAMGHFGPMVLYGSRIKELKAYRKTCGRIVSERYLKFYLDKHKISVVPDGNISISLIRPLQRPHPKTTPEESREEIAGSEGGANESGTRGWSGRGKGEEREIRSRREDLREKWEARKERKQGKKERKG